MLPSGTLRNLRKGFHEPKWKWWRWWSILCFSLFFKLVLFWVFLHCACALTLCSFIRLSSLESWRRSTQNILEQSVEATEEVKLSPQIYSSGCSVNDVACSNVLSWYRFTCTWFPGAASSGDIDILLTHPRYTSETEKQVSLFSSATYFLYPVGNAVCCHFIRLSSFPAQAPPCSGRPFGVHWLCDWHSVQRRHQVHGERCAYFLPRAQLYVFDVVTCNAVTPNPLGAWLRWWCAGSCFSRESANCSRVMKMRKNIFTGVLISGALLYITLNVYSLGI